MDNLQILNLLLEFLQNNLREHMEFDKKIEAENKIVFYCDPLVICSDTDKVLKTLIKRSMEKHGLDVRKTEIINDSAVYLEGGQIIFYTIFDPGSAFNRSPDSVVIISVLNTKNIFGNN